MLRSPHAVWLFVRGAAAHNQSKRCRREYAFTFDCLACLHGNATQSNGLGEYFCSRQTSRHLKMVKFELQVASDGSLFAKATDAGYVSGNHGTAASETKFASARKVSIATSATSCALSTPRSGRSTNRTCG